MTAAPVVRADSSKPYGDVSYADPGYQKDKKKRYPIDTAEHCKAAWSYINQADNASKYTSEQLSAIKGRIKSAAKKFGITIASDSMNSAPPPRDVLYRAQYPGVVLAERAEGDGMPTMTGHFAVFNQWTEINSLYEGHFLERVTPGAFAKTFRDNRAGMRVLFQHGKDPQIGDKPLGMIEDLSEDDTGARYTVPLFDTTYNRDLVPGLRAGAYGASFRFRVTREAFNRSPEPSEYNPDGLPERTIQEASVSEFGPVTFPAYAGATAGVRSLTDDFLIQAFTQSPDRLRELMQHLPNLPQLAAIPPIPAHAPLDDAGSTTSSGRREPGTRPLVVIRKRDMKGGSR